MAEPGKAEEIGIPTSPSRRDEAWAVITCVLLALASLWVWNSLQAHEAEHNRRTTLQFARGIASEIEWTLHDQIRASRRLAGFWVRFGRQTWDEWEFDTRLYLEDNGLDSIIWVDPDFQDRVWEAHLAEPMKPAREEDLAILLHGQEATVNEGMVNVVGPFPLQDGNHAYWTMVPVGKKTPAVLISGMRLDALFEAVLRSHTEQCAMEVREADRVLFSHRRPDCETAPAADVPIHVFSESIWTLRIAPSRDIIQMGNPVSEIVLAGGLLTSVLLGSVIWNRGVSKAAATALIAANRRLEKSTQEARWAEAEVRKLNQELESRVRARTAELDDAIAELEAFNYSVSHDLRSPLGAIVNFAAILEQDQGPQLDDEGLHHVDRIRRSAATALTMMDALLEFSRTGRTRLDRTPLDVRDLVREVWNELTALEPHRESELQMSEVPRVVADAALLRLVWSNLLSNALKFSGIRPKAVIEVGGKREDGRCIFWIKDNGVGFPTESAHKLFKVFKRLHSSSQFPGTGVGLAIVDRIVRRHEGRVWCEGAPDEGATFFFSLPAGDDHETTEGLPSGPDR